MAWRETHLNQQLKEKVSASDWFISAGITENLNFQLNCDFKH